MASGEVIGGVFFAADELLRVEQLTVSSGPHLIDDGGFQIQEHGAGDVLSGSGFTEESVEGVVSASDGFVTRHLTIRLQIPKLVKHRKQINKLERRKMDRKRRT